jgi:hypothetical protein
MSIGTIVVDLLARTGSFDTDINRSAKLAEKRAKEIDAAFSKVGAAVVGGLTLAAGALGALAMSAVDQLAQLDDMAQKTGSSVESLSRIQSVALTFSQDMGQVDDAITRLARGMAEVESDSNRTAKALAALGLSSRDVAGNLRDPSELFTEIAKKLQDYEDGAAKAALVTDLFGKSGAALLPFLNDLADNVDNATKVTAEAAAEAANFQDNLGRLKTSVRDLGQSILGDLLPSLNSLATTLQNIQKTSFTGWLLSSGKETEDPGKRLKEIREQLDGIAKQRAEYAAMPAWKQLFESDNTAILDTQEALLRKQEAYLKTVQQTQALALGGGADQNDRRANPAPARLNYQAGATGGGGRGAKAAAERQSEAERYLKTLEAQLITTKDLTVAEETLAKIKAGQLGVVTEDMQQQLLAAATLVDMTRDQIAAEKERQDLLKEGRKLYEETRSPAERLNAEYSRLNDLLAAGAIDWDTYARGTFAAQDQFDKLVLKADETASALDIFSENAARGIQSALADFLFDPFEEGLDGMLKGFATTLQRMAAEAAASEIARSLFGGLIKGGSGSGLIGEGLSWLGGLFGGARASGGPMDPGKVYLTGERGPELVVPRSASTVIPNHMLGGGGGGKVVVNLHNAPQGTEVQQSQSDDGTVTIDVLYRAVDARINQQLRQGGVIRDAINGKR